MLRPLRNFLSVVFLFIVSFATIEEANAQLGCGGFNGAPQPTGGPQSIDNGQICLNKPGAPAQIRISAFNVADGNNANNFAVEIDWDDGSPRQVVAYGGPIPITHPNPHEYNIPSITHTFLPRPCAARPGAECAYRPRVFLRIAGLTCPAQFGTSPDFFRFNTDNQCSGDMTLSETVTGATVFEVCQGASTAVTFTDRTVLNCLPPQELTGLNFYKRWRNFTYGTTNTITGTVTVGGTPIGAPFTSPGVPDVSTEPLNISTPPFANNNTQIITIPATALVGEEFHIRLNYWNYCNQYTDGDAPVYEYGIIRVVAQPTAPTPVNQDVCNAATITNFRINFAATSDRVYWYRDNAGVPGAMVTNPNGNNSKNFPPASFPGGAVSNTVPGVYRMWASYRAQVGAGSLRCESILVPVTITIRNPVPTPVFNVGTDPVCNGSNGVAYGVTVPAGTLTPGGPTEYLWDVVNAANVVVADVTITPNSGQNATAQNVAADFNIANATFGGAPSIIRKIRVRRRFVNTPFCESTIVEYPVTVFRNTNAGTLAGGDTKCEGAALNPLTWTPGVGNIIRWEMAINAGGFATVPSFGTSNPVNPTTLALMAIAGATTTYTFRAQIQNGNCAPAATNNIVYTINPNTVSADAGPPSDIFCQTLPSPAPLVYPLNGNVPGGGVTGLWTQVSGPGTTAFAPNAGLFNATATVTLPGVYVFRWTLDNTTCQSQDQIQILYGYAPGIPTPNTTNTCGINGTLSVSNHTGSETVTWAFVSGPAGGVPVIANPTDPSTAVSVNNIFGVYNFNVTFTGIACGGSNTVPVAITFFQQPTSAPEANKTVCVDGSALAPFPITGVVGGGASQGHWTIVTGTGTFISSGTATGSSIVGPNVADNYLPSAADYAAGTVTLRLVGEAPGGSPCPNANNDLVVTFDKKPANAFVNPTGDVCGTVATIVATPVPAALGEGIWSIVSPSGQNITDPSNPTTTVTDLQFGNNDFLWTVTSNLGVCAPTSAPVTVVRTTAPAVNNQNISDLCETNANTGVAQGVDLAAGYDAFITGGGPGVNVSWFRNAARTIVVADVTNEDVSNNEVFYVRVSSTGVPPCTADGVVSFTINSKPFVANLNPSLCEEVLGGGIINNVNLTTNNNNVSIAVPGRIVTWFSDNMATVPVPTPTDVDGVTDGMTFYARVENPSTGCFNIAEVMFNVNAIPPANPIIGPNAVCLDPNAVIFFTVTNFHPGYTYQWTVPGTVTVANGSTTDFFLLLKFPTVIPGGIDVQVVETSPEGCPGVPEIIHVDIEDQPNSLVITGPTAICENDTDVIFTVPLYPNITYAWSVPPGASIILGQGSNEVHVNFGTNPGNVVVTPSTPNGCTGPMAQQHVDINRRPIIDDNLGTAACSQTAGQITFAVETSPASEPAVSYNFKARVPDAGLFTLNAPVTPVATGVADNVIYNDVFENKTATPLNVRYTVSGMSAANCEGPDQVITLIVNPEPQLDPLLGKSICSNELTGITLISAVNTFPADGFIITAVNIPGGVVPAATSSPIPVPSTTTINPADIIKLNSWVNTTGTNQTVSYQILPYSSLLGCAGSPPTPVNVTIYPSTVVTPVPDPMLCNGDLLNVTFTSTNNPDPGVSYYWSVKTYGPDMLVGSPSNGVGNINGLGLQNRSLTQNETVTFEVYAKNPAGQDSPSGCANPIQTFTVTVKKSPEAIPQTLTICSDTPGGSTYVANLLALQPNINTTGDPNIQFTWINTDGVTPISPATLTAFTMNNNAPVFVEVKDLSPGSQCSKVVPVTYTINPGVSVATPILSQFGAFNLACFNDKSGAIRIDVLTGSPVLSYRYSIDGGPQINAGAQTYTFNGLDAGAHSILIEDANGCKVTQPATLIQPPVLAAVLNKVQDVTCFLGQDGIISTVASGGTGTYSSYLLLQTNTIDPDVDGIFPNLGGGVNYNVRVTDSNNCKVDTSPVLVTQPTPVEINAVNVLTDAGGFNLSCRDALDGSITVVFQGGNTPANYTVTLTKSSDPMNPLVINTPTSPATFTNLGFGNYSVVVTDAKGCPSLPGSAIIVNPPPFSPGFIGINQSICRGVDADPMQQLVPAFGGVGNYQYEWQYSVTGSMSDAEWLSIPGATGMTYDPAVLDTTTYFRRVTRSVSTRTGTACSELGKDNIVKVQINPLPVVAFNGPSEVCQGDAFNLQLTMTRGTAPIEYDYSSGATTFLNLIGTENTSIPVSNFQSPQTYTLIRVKDLNGCEAANVPLVATVDIIKLNPDFQVLAPAEQCSGGTFNFQWVVEAGVKYTWIWSDGQQTVFQPGDLPLGTQPISHVFSSGSTESSTIFPVRLQAENALCSPKSATKPITVYPNVILNILPGDPILCSGESIRFIDQSNGVDVGKWYYHAIGSPDEMEIKAGPVADITYTMTNITTTNPIQYEVVYEASNTEGCKAEYRLPVTVYRGILSVIGNNPDPPNPFTGGISTIEFVNNSNPLDAGDFEYTWDFGDARAQPATGTGVDPITVDYFSAGIKDVRLRAVNIEARNNNKTCVSSVLKKINIELPMLGAAFRATPLASCFPVNITVENLSPGADTFMWELYNETGLVSTSNLRDPVFRILTPGVYDIYLTASFYATGQTANAEQKGIEVFDVPTALFEMRPNPLYVPDTELQTFNQSQRATQYHWDFDDGGTSEEFQPRHLYQLEGKYLVSLIAGYDHGMKDIDGDGILDMNVVCYDTVRHELVAQDGGYIKLPNAFTPSLTGPSGGVAGSGTFNDVFLPIARGVEEFQMQIFDRWGNLVFESKDRNVGWDGYDRNHRIMPAGVYVYKLILRLSNGQRTTKVGDVTLIR